MSKENPGTCAVLFSWSSASGHAQQRSGWILLALAASDLSQHCSPVLPSHPAPHPALPETCSSPDRNSPLQNYFPCGMEQIPCLGPAQRRKSECLSECSCTETSFPLQGGQRRGHLQGPSHPGLTSVHNMADQDRLGHPCPMLTGSTASEGGVSFWHGIVISSAWAERDRD